MQQDDGVVQTGAEVCAKLQSHHCYQNTSTRLVTECHYLLSNHYLTNNVVALNAKTIKQSM